MVPIEAKNNKKSSFIIQPDCTVAVWQMKWRGGDCCVVCICRVINLVGVLSAPLLCVVLKDFIIFNTTRGA